MAKPHNANQVARRALALFSAVGVALGSPRKDVVDWIDKNGLRGELSPAEAAFLATKRPLKKDMINFGWHSERLIVLVWALGMIDDLPPPDEQCDTSVLQDLLPPFTDISVEEFLTSAKLRPVSALNEMEDRLMQLHWCARDAKLNSRPPREPVDGEVIQERHHAIKWIINLDGEDWDDVSTDT